MILFVRSTRSSTSCKLSITPWRSDNLKNGTVFFSKQDKQGSVIHIVFVLVVVAKTKLRKTCMEVCYTSHAANLDHILWLQWNQQTSSYTGCKHPSYCYLLVPKRSTPVHKCIRIYIYTPTHRATWRGLFWMVHWYTSTERMDSRVHPIPQLNGNH